MDFPTPPYLPEGYSLTYLDHREHDNRHAETVWSLAQVSNCLKMKTGALIVKDGKTLGSGTNTVERPPEKCPREGMATGVAYDLCWYVCRQIGHAEYEAIENALDRNPNVDMRGATLYLSGHWWVCKECWDHIIRVGIKEVLIVV